MQVELLTKQDFLDFKYELLQEITQLLKTEKPRADDRELLKTNEVRKILKCSLNTINRLKREGKLPFTRVLRTIYFKKSDIDKLIADGFEE